MDEGTRALEQLVTRFPRLSDADRTLLRKLLADFEANWSPQHLARSVAELPGADTAIRRPALFGTLLVDLRRRWESGKPIAVEQYLQQFPELADEGREIVGLLQEEYELRKNLGHSVSIDQYVGRFPKYATAIRRWTSPAKQTDGEIDLEASHETLTPRSSGKSSDVSDDLAETTDPQPTTHGQKDLTNAGNLPAMPMPTPSPPAHASPPPAGAAGAAAADPDGPRESAHPSLPHGMVMGELRGDFGRYKIVRRLGRGGMGTVFLAIDTQLERQVALKVPNFSEDSNGAALVPARFRQEARAAAGLSHANICAVYDVGCIEGVHYITMAYVEGSPLSLRLKGNKWLPPDEAVSLVRRIALALGYAHGTGVVHRDLKPANIMITPGGEPVVMDFGLARRSDEQGTRLTVTGEVIGTIAYMPPEQLSGDLDRIGPHSDVYSLGCILYESLTGQLPFDGPPATLIMKLLREDPKPIGELQPELAGSPLDAIIRKAMAKKVVDRYPTMIEFEASLAATVGEKPAAEKPKVGVKTMAGDRRADPNTLVRDRPARTMTPPPAGLMTQVQPPPRRQTSSSGKGARIPMLLGVLALLAFVGCVAAWQFVPQLSEKFSSLFARSAVPPIVDDPKPGDPIPPIKAPNTSTEFGPKKDPVVNPKKDPETTKKDPVVIPKKDPETTKKDPVVIPKRTRRRRRRIRSSSPRRTRRRRRRIQSSSPRRIRRRRRKIPSLSPRRIRRSCRRRIPR